MQGQVFFDSLLSCWTVVTWAYAKLDEIRFMSLLNALFCPPHHVTRQRVSEGLTFCLNLEFI